VSFPSPFDVGRDIAAGLSSFIKHGNNADVGSTYEPVATSGHVELRPPSGAAPLRIVSSNAGDTAAGLGARSVMLTGLDAQGNTITETLAMSGTTPSAYTTRAFWRLNFVDVLASGTYANAAAGSHLGNLTVSDSTAAIWAVMLLNGYANSRWQSCWYTVPNGVRAFVNGYRVGVESNKTANVKLLARRDALTGAAPFAPMMELTELTGVAGSIDVDLPFVFGPLPACTDIGAIAQMEATSGRVSVDFDLILERAG